MADRKFRTLQKVVAAAGTPEQLAALSTYTEDSVLIKAKKTNTGIISIASSSAEALISNADGFTLDANEAIELDVDNLDEIWLDAEVSGEGVEIILG